MGWEKSRSHQALRQAAGAGSVPTALGTYSQLGRVGGGMAPAPVGGVETKEQPVLDDLRDKEESASRMRQAHFTALGLVRTQPGMWLRARLTIF